MTSERQRIEKAVTILVAKPLAWIVYGSWVLTKQATKTVRNWLWRARPGKSAQTKST